MKRTRLRVLSASVLGFMLLGSVSQGEAAGAVPKRIVVSGEAAKKLSLTARYKLPDGRVTLSVTADQLARLQNDHVPYTEIPLRSARFDWACFFTSGCDPWASPPPPPDPATKPSFGTGTDWLCWVFTCTPSGGGTVPTAPPADPPAQNQSSSWLCLIFTCSPSDGSPAGPVTSPKTPGAVYQPPGSPSKAKRADPPATQIPYGVQVMYGQERLKTSDMRGGAGVKVAILDTGYYEHQDFKRADGSTILGGCKSYVSGMSPYAICQDTNGHGTHITGIVAGSAGKDRLGIYGVAPDAEVFMYRVLDESGIGYADDVAQAIRDAATAGANIILMAFGGGEPSDIEKEAIEFAVSKGSLLIASAGRLTDVQMEYPAKYPGVMSVGPSHSWFFDVGNREAAELNGPAHQVLSTANTGKYASMSGTSQSAAYVAGLAAKVWQGSAEATRDHLRRLAHNGGMDGVPQLRPAAITFTPTH